jgi:hypothetical protein
MRNATTAIGDLVTNIEPTAHTGKMRPVVLAQGSSGRLLSPVT